MFTDTLFLSAAAIALISLPRILVAFVQKTMPRRWFIVLGACMVVMLILKWLKPGVYSWGYVGQLVIEVIAKILN